MIFIPHRSLALWLVHWRYTPECVHACTVSLFDILNLWYSHERHVAHWSANSNSVWEQQDISFGLSAHTPLRKTSLKDKQISIPSSCFCLSIPHLPLCCHAWGQWVAVCVCLCVTDSPIETDVCVHNSSLFEPLLTTVFHNIAGHTHLFPFSTPCACMHTPLQCDSVRWSSIDKLINSVLLSSCEEELNLLCLTDLTGGFCSCCVCVGVWGVSYVEALYNSKVNCCIGFRTNTFSTSIKSNISRYNTWHKYYTASPSSLTGDLATRQYVCSSSGYIDLCLKPTVIGRQQHILWLN